MSTIEDKLFKKIYSFKHDPEGFVNYVYPWGEEGTILAEDTGADIWQSGVLQKIRYIGGESLADVIQIAVASGTGIGKGALVSWIIHWFASTRKQPDIVVTANTKTQLTTKTWRELSKWHNLSIHKHWFKWTATKFYHVDFPGTWFAEAIPWSEQNSQSFAGTHDKNTLIIFDEASTVADIIWEVTRGSMTTPGAAWLVFGNPTENTGEFRECFGKNRHRWDNKQIDSRTCKMTNKKEIQKWIDDYGEDSDYVRVRVKGMFPRSSTMQFMSLEDIEVAMARNLDPKDYMYSPIILGVDAARGNADQSVICVRQGLKIHELRKYRELDGPALAARIVACENDYSSYSSVITTFIDNVGVGTSAYDTLINAKKHPIPVMGNKNATKKQRYYNKRTEMWCTMKEWILLGGDILDDIELKNDLMGPLLGYSGIEQFQLERKTDMLNRGLNSPDCADALAFTFAMPFKSNPLGRPDIDSIYYPDEHRYERQYASTSITGY